MSHQNTQITSGWPTSYQSCVNKCKHESRKKKENESRWMFCLYLLGEQRECPLVFFPLQEPGPPQEAWFRDVCGWKNQTAYWFILHIKKYTTPIPAAPEGLSSWTCWPFHSWLPYYNHNLPLDDAWCNYIRGRRITLAIYLCLSDGGGGDVFTQWAAPCSAPPQSGAHWTPPPAYPTDWQRTPGEWSKL